VKNETGRVVLSQAAAEREVLPQQVRVTLTHERIGQGV
jgi:hypothetical protein